MEQLAVLFVTVGMIVGIIGAWRVVAELFHDNGCLRIVCLLFPMLGLAAALLRWDELKELRTPFYILLAGTALAAVGVVLAFLSGSA